MTSSNISLSYDSISTNSEYHCEDAIIITKHISSTMDTISRAISTGSGPHTNSSSISSLPDTISTCDDPQQTMTTSNIVPPDATSTSSYPQQVDSNSSASLPDTISTGPDPQQATSITIPLDTASTMYPQVNSISSVSLPDTISTDSQLQQVNTTSSISPSDSGSSNQQEFSTLHSGATNLILSMHQQDNSS